jgi:hypothetical protein
MNSSDDTFWYLVALKRMARELSFVIVIGLNLKRERAYVNDAPSFSFGPKIWGIWGGNVLIWRVSWFLGEVYGNIFSFILPLFLVWTFELAIRGQWHQDEEPLVLEAQLFVASVSCWLLSEVEKLVLSISCWWSVSVDFGLS